MSFPALTAAMLLGSAPVNPVGTSPAATQNQACQVAADQTVRAPVAPAAQADPPPPASGTESAVPPESAAAAPEASAPGASAANPSPSTQTPGSGAKEDEIVVTGRRENPGDPFEDINAKSFQVVQDLDKAVVGPVALAYKENVPGPIRKGIRNFLNNLAEPVVFLNFLLQLKPGKAAETLGRFAINSTVGVAGLVDAAKKQPFGLPRRPNGFANTMGYYGVKPGPYFFLPLIGATTLRDLVGNGLDRLLFPGLLGKPFNDPRYVIPSVVIRQIDDRAEFNEQLHVLRDQSIDPYLAMRKYYLESRQAEIDALHGKHRVSTSPASPPTQPCR